MNFFLSPVRSGGFSMKPTNPRPTIFPVPIPKEVNDDETYYSLSTYLFSVA